MLKIFFPYRLLVLEPASVKNEQNILSLKELRENPNTVIQVKTIL